MSTSPDAVDTGAPIGVPIGFCERIMNERRRLQIFLQQPDVLALDEVGVNPELSVCVGIGEEVVDGMPREGLHDAATTVDSESG